MILIKQTEIRIMIIYDMKTEDLINPIGIDEKKPRFSWKLQSKISGTLQTAYRIIVRSDNDTVLSLIHIFFLTRCQCQNKYKH